MRTVCANHDAAWETRWAPYDETTYQLVLDSIQPDEIVLEIGAGDLRLARRLAQRAASVYAIEIQLPLLAPTWNAPGDALPANLRVIWADARHIPFPAGITTGVLLMRHCTTFGLYREKLITAGADRLFTNARWRMGVEMIDLHTQPVPYPSIAFGWYGCTCGSVGFVPGDPDYLTEGTLNYIHEVVDCPRCADSRKSPARAKKMGAAPRLWKDLS